jgi:hypothetical protein
MADNDKTKKADVKEAEAAADDGLVEMSKGFEVSRVHPTCVKDHERAGWTQ